MQCDAVRCNEVMDSGEVQRKIRESEVLEFPNFGNVRELLFVQVLKIDTGEAKNNTVQNDCASQPNDDASHPNDDASQPKDDASHPNDAEPLSWS
jgi:hypothetical protein